MTDGCWCCRCWLRFVVVVLLFVVMVAVRDAVFVGLCRLLVFVARCCNVLLFGVCCLLSAVCCSL